MTSMDDTLRVFRVGSSYCSATFSCTSSSSNVRDKITTVFVATEGKGYSSSSSKSCRPKSLLQEMSDPIVPVVSWYVVFERENFKYFSLQIFLSSMFLLCHSTYENVTHSYCARKSLEKSTLECTLDCDQRSNTGLRVRNSFARFRIGVVPMKSLCMHLEYPLMRQLSYFTPLRFVMLRGIQHVLVLRYVV